MSFPRKSRPPAIQARRDARTQLYAMLYGPCTAGASQCNTPWADPSRGKPTKPDFGVFESLCADAQFKPEQLARVKARFAAMEG